MSPLAAGSTGTFGMVSGGTSGLVSRGISGGIFASSFLDGSAAPGSGTCGTSSFGVPPLGGGAASGLANSAGFTVPPGSAAALPGGTPGATGRGAAGAGSALGGSGLAGVAGSTWTVGAGRML